jgi:hypothetical protein
MINISVYGYFLVSLAENYINMFYIKRYQVRDKSPNPLRRSLLPGDSGEMCFSSLGDLAAVLISWRMWRQNASTT